MKYLYQLFIAFFCVVAFASCGEDDYLEIDSLSADGDEFYCNQKVKLWMCVRSSDLWHTDYQWSCEGGSITQPQGLNEQTWKAPAVPGIYTVTCTAKIGDAVQTRSHKMYVSSYYFDKFEKSSHSLNLQSNNKNSLKTESNGNQYLQIYVNSSSEVKRYVRRQFGDETLHTPFSTRMKLGFDQNVPNTQMVTVGSKSETAMLEYRWTMNSNVANQNNYVSYVAVRWYPSVPTDGYPLVADATEGEQELSVEGTPEYNIVVAVQHTSAEGKQTTHYEYHYLNTMNNFVAKDYKTVSMSIDENEQLYMHVAGQEALSSSLVADIRNANACQGNLYVQTWYLYYINGNGGRNIPYMYIDDAYGSNTEILK